MYTVDTDTFIRLRLRLGKPFVIKGVCLFPRNKGSASIRSHRGRVSAVRRTGVRKEETRRGGC
jgi:hypothetical protein